MGFWSVVGDLIGAAVNGVAETGREMQQAYDKYHSRYSDMDDDGLMREMRKIRDGGGSMGSDKMARMKALSDVMKERGLIDS